MKIAPMLLAGVCGLAPALCAQQVAIPTVSLKATIAGETPLDRPTLLKSAACDAAGNVYTQRTPGPDDMRPPIQEITAEAKSAGTYRLPDGYAGEVGAGFVAHDGVVYMAVDTRSGIYVQQFARDGSVRAKTKLQVDSDVQAWLLAVFKSGEFLLVGQRGKNLRTPFTAVFAADGRLVKEVYEPEDEEARRRAEAGDPKFGPSPFSNRFVSRGDVAAGADGNVYLLHGVSPPLVYVISPVGDVIRKFRIETGGRELTAGAIRFHAGRLAIRFDELSDSGQYLIKVIDTQGKSLGDYEVGSKEANPLALACYDAEGFTLVSESAESKLYLLKAKLP
jgi:hypothetical protein